MNDKKKLLIGILCGLIMVMAVGSALLAQQLSYPMVVSSNFGVRPVINLLKSSIE